MTTSSSGIGKSPAAPAPKEKRPTTLLASASRSALVAKGSVDPLVSMLIGGSFPIDLYTSADQSINSPWPEQITSNQVSLTWIGLPPIEHHGWMEVYHTGDKLSWPGTSAGLYTRPWAPLP